MVTGAWYQGLLGYAYAISGDRPKAEQILRELEEMAKRQYVSSTAFADIHLGLGEKEKALDWLEKSYQDQESACWYLKVDPIYDSVRNEPRFQAILKKDWIGIGFGLRHARHRPESHADRAFLRREIRAVR